MTKEKSIVIILAGILLGLLIIIFCSVNASADEPRLSRRTDAAETEFKAEIKDVLGEYGMRTAGVTLTKVSFDGINITYNVQIHISSFKTLNNWEKEELIRDLKALEIAVGNSEVNYSFS